LIYKSLLISLLTPLILFFGVSYSFKSESIIFINDSSTSIQSSLVSSFISSTPESVYQLKEFLNSKDASKRFRESVDIEAFYESKEIKFFSRFTGLFNQTFHDYYKRVVDVNIESDSNTLKISTIGFTPDNARISNLALINLTVEFFNNKQRNSSLISKSNKICELYLKSSDINAFEDKEIINPINNENLESFGSANELLRFKVLKHTELCQKLSLGNDPVNQLDINIPKYDFDNINSTSIKQALAEIYDDSIKSISLSDSVVIISEPNLPDEEEPKYFIIYTIAVFLIILLINITKNIFYKLRQDLQI